jgi:hypothetical protein
MRSALVAATLVVASPVFAASVPAAEGTVAHTGQMLRDAANVRIGTVDSVKPDGSVGVIVEGRYVVVPVNTLAVADGKLTTSLSKKMLVGLN